MRSRDRKSTRLNSSHMSISYAVFCLKKKNKITQNFRARGRANTRRADVVFERNRDTVERAAITAFSARAKQFTLGLARLLEGKFRRDRDVCIQPRIQPLDALEHQLRKLNGRELTFTKEAGDFLNRGKREIGVIHWWKSKVPA